MLCYRDTSFCSDADECKTPCSRRLNQDEYEASCKRANFEFPVAYMTMRKTCERFEKK